MLTFSEHVFFRHHPGLLEPVAAMFDRGPAALAEYGQGRTSSRS